MGSEGELKNRLRAVRSRLGISQQELAAAAGIARQTIGGIEAGTYALSLSVALRLARALGCPVDELFWLEEDLPTVPATLVGKLPATPEPQRVALAQVGGQWVAHPLTGEQAFRHEMVPADGLAVRDEAGQLTVRLLDEPEALGRTVLLAGCTPALSLWARSAERWHPGLRVHWTHANSTAALKHLARGEVHLAGVHLFDMETGAGNAAFVRQALGDGAALALVNLGVWEEGLVVAVGNPKQLRYGMDLTQPGVRLINREAGAGSRLLLDALLKQDGISPKEVKGYTRLATGHLEVAREVASGAADVGVSTAAVAAAFGLGFVPVRQVAYDLALRRETLELAPVQQLIGTLQHRWVRTQLSVVGGYDTSRTGDIVDV
jgi:putative molybdopterin biosynthesis protein